MTQRRCGVGYDKNSRVSRLVRFSTIATEIPRILIANPTPTFLYSTLAKGPKLSAKISLILPGTSSASSTASHYQRDRRRRRIFRTTPTTMAWVNELHRNGELSIRLAYNLFTQKPKQELSDFQAGPK